MCVRMTFAQEPKQIPANWMKIKTGNVSSYYYCVIYNRLLGYHVLQVFITSIVCTILNILSCRMTASCERLPDQYDPIPQFQEFSHKLHFP